MMYAGYRAFIWMCNSMLQHKCDDFLQFMLVGILVVFETTFASIGSFAFIIGLLWPFIEWSK